MLAASMAARRMKDWSQEPTRRLSIPRSASDQNTLTVKGRYKSRDAPATHRAVGQPSPAVVTDAYVATVQNHYIPRLVQAHHTNIASAACLILLPRATPFANPPNKLAVLLPLLVPLPVEIKRNGEQHTAAAREDYADDSPGSPTGLELPDEPIGRQPGQEIREARAGRTDRDAVVRQGNLPNSRQGRAHGQHLLDGLEALGFLAARPLEERVRHRRVDGLKVVVDDFEFEFWSFQRLQDAHGAPRAAQFEWHRRRSHAQCSFDIMPVTVRKNNHINKQKNELITILTSTSTDSDWYALHPQFLVSFPSILFPVQLRI